MSEQQRPIACPHPEAVGTRWGDPISAERQAELQGYLDRWAAETDHGERKGPFDEGPRKAGVLLTGADVFWLAEQSGRDENRQASNLHLEGANLGAAHLERANLRAAHLERADLRAAHLEGARLEGAHLERADLRVAHLEGADLHLTHLEKADLHLAHLEKASLGRAYLEEAILVEASLDGADLYRAHLEEASLSRAHLDGANLYRAHLEGAILTGAYLEEATIIGASLERADLSGAHLKGATLIGTSLKGANLVEAHLERADLSGTWLDSKTDLSDATLDKQTKFGDIQWSGVGAVNLTRLPWDAVPTLGDELDVNLRSPVKDHERVVRVYRQLAAQLRAQGMSEVADRFLYRSQMWQRRVLLRQGNLGGYLFSLLLAALSGYGYKLGRIFVAYVLVVLLFAVGYFLSGGLPGQADLPIQQQALDSVQVSLNAIHGRVFFTSLGLDTLQSWLATIESVVGIVIEGVFVAMLIQRFFGR